MRELRAQNRVCDRAREYSSRSLDGELSDFERALLETHLERCDECRAYATELAEIVTRLRAAPLEALPHPVALPSRRRVRTRALQGAAAAAAAVVAVTAGLVGSFWLVSGFFVGNRGPVRLKSDLGAPLFGSRFVRWATPEERDETINMSAVYVLLGFVLILFGFVADTRYSLF
jgi:predicted anti-sigma-YlaC factor YlaD